MKRVAFRSLIIALIFAGCNRPTSVQWSPEAAMDHQFFPALVIATASVRPVDDEDEEAQKPDPYLLGDKFGLLGVSIKSSSPHTSVKVVIKENDVMAASSWSGFLTDANHDYYIAPKLNYKFDHLRKVTQQVPLNVDFEVQVNGKSLGDKAETLQVRSINDCPYGVANSEETVDDENLASGGSADLGWMFAAYVNENHPHLDKILQEALATKMVDAFDGYQANDPADVLKQVFAIWAAVQKRGLKYSSVTEVPGGSSLVNSQFVRFLDQSVTNTQANCVDGSVLFASLLRKVGIEPFLVAVPGHMYIGFYLNQSADDDEVEFVGLETTLIGAADAEDSDTDPPEALAHLADQLNDKTINSKAWKTFVAAITTATDDLDEKADEFDAGNPEYQTIDIAQARSDGIMPIAFDAVSR